MEQSNGLTDLQKVEEILAEIEKAAVASKPDAAQRFIRGKVGADIKFDAQKTAKCTEIGLHCGNELLGCLQTNSGFALKPNSQILVMSPKTRFDSSLSKVTRENDLELEIRYSAKETPEMVVNYIYNAVVLSTTKIQISQIAKKLSKLNLGNLRAVDAVEYLASMLDDTPEKSR